MVLHNKANLISTLHHPVAIYPVTDLVVNESPVVENAHVSVMQWKSPQNVINRNVGSIIIFKIFY